MKTLQVKQIIQSNEKPFWTHPALTEYLNTLGKSEWFTDEEWKDLQDYFNADVKIIYMQDVESDELCTAYAEDTSVLLQWDVTQYQTNGNIVLCVSDTEDGACIWVAKPRLSLPENVVKSIGEVP